MYQKNIKKLCYLLVSVLLVVIIIINVKTYKKQRKIEKEIHREVAKKTQREKAFEAMLEQSAKIPASYWDKKYEDMPIKSKYKVVFVATRGGEYNYAKTFQYAANKMGWDVRVYGEDINGRDDQIIAFDPDFIMYSNWTNHELTPELIAHRSKKYSNNHSTLRSILHRFGEINDVDTISENMKQFLFPFHGVFNLSPEVDIFRQIFIKQGKIFNGIAVFPFTPGLINDPAEPKCLAWGGMGWDKFRSSDNFRKFITLLSNNISMKVYGPYSYLSYLPKGVYDGYTPSGMEQINAIRNNGIYLLTHADLYLKDKAPTSRIFEALAANVVVISDRHSFAIEHFGDNFLYFDQNADAETMYKQVKVHYDWIKANPEKAKAMAAKAHQIFLEKFTVEKDLVRMAKMHEYVLKQEKEMGLSYPLAY